VCGCGNNASAFPVVQIISNTGYANEKYSAVSGLASAYLDRHGEIAPNMV
jgi:hypothetical protein